MREGYRPDVGREISGEPEEKSEDQEVKVEEKENEPAFFERVKIVHTNAKNRIKHGYDIEELRHFDKKNRILNSELRHLSLNSFAQIDISPRDEKVLYDYDGQGELQVVSTYKKGFINDEWKFNGAKKYSKDSQGNLIVEHLDKNNQLMPRREIHDWRGRKIEYQENGQLKEVVELKRDDQDRIIEKNTYDKNGKLLKKEKISYTDSGKETVIEDGKGKIKEKIFEEISRHEIKRHKGKDKKSRDDGNNLLDTTSESDFHREESARNSHATEWGF